VWAEEELKERVHTYLVDLTNRRSIYEVAKEVMKDVGPPVHSTHTFPGGLWWCAMWAHVAIAEACRTC
jgi:hypothetical protein